MTFYEYGKENDRTIVLIHPSIVMWDYFEYVIPLLDKDFHLVIPSLPGYNPDRKDDFTSVEEIAAEIEAWLMNHSIPEVECAYGCSMGGSIVTRMLANARIKFKNAVIDGGITPYQLPWIVTRVIAIKDFLLISAGKFGGIKLLELAFSTDKLSKEDIEYASKVLKMISYKTIWRTFDSCNNYSMPIIVREVCPNIEYWVAEEEVKDRKTDIAYIKKVFPKTRFRLIKNVGHGGLAPFKPEKFARGIRKVCGKRK